MKVIFLDIDGVLNSVRSAVAFDGFPWNVDEENIKQFDFTAIALIRKACRVFEAKIILSSTWRMSVPYTRLAEALNLPMVGATPSKFSASRGEEIALWLRDNKVDKYVIVDDDSDMLPEQLPYFVKTDNYEGLLYKDYLKVVELLSTEKEEGK